MAYIVTNTRGQIVAVVQDGTVDTTSTSQAILGKNATPYGQFAAENLVHQLENFANDVPPPFPIEGQLWYDTSENRAYAWSGTEWKPVSGMTVSVEEPTTDPSTGDFWFNPITRQLQIYSPLSAGSGFIPVTNVRVAPAAPTDSVTGDLYFNSTSLQLFVRANNQWNLATGVVGSANGGTGFSSYSLGDILFGNSTGSLNRGPLIGVSPIAVSNGDVGVSLSWSGPDIPAVFGTVTSINIAGAGGIGVSGSPITTSGTVTLTNTGVTSIIAGSNIAVDSSNGAVTISTVNSGTVSSVGTGDGLQGGPVTSTGTISVDSTVLRTNAVQTVTTAKTFTGGINSQQYTFQNSLFDMASSTGPDQIAVTVNGQTTHFFYANRFVVTGTPAGPESGELGVGGVLSGINTAASSAQAGVFGEQQSNTGVAVRAGATNLAYTGSVLNTRTTRAASTVFSHIGCFTEQPGAGIPVFIVNGQGDTYARTYNSIGADYAEYFEWQDGNPNNQDRSGMTVSLVGNKIRIAQPGDTVIGVVSTEPGFIGDATEQFWPDLYLKDEFGRLLRETYHCYEWLDADGQTQSEPSYGDLSRVPAGAQIRTTDDDGKPLTRPRINPAWDPNQVYIPRSERPEWCTVGLVGKLRVLNGQQLGTNWIKMRDITANIAEYLIR